MTDSISAIVVVCYNVACQKIIKIIKVSFLPELSEFHLQTFGFSRIITSKVVIFVMQQRQSNVVIPAGTHHHHHPHHSIYAVITECLV